MHMDEAPLLEEAVDRVGHAAADAEDRAEEVRAGPQVGDGAQEFEAVPFLLQRIVLRCGPDEGDAGGLQLPALALALRGDDGALDLDRGPGAGRDDGLGVARQGRVGHDLEIREAAPVVDFEEGKRLRVPLRPHPAFHDDGAGGGFAAQEIGNTGSGHAGKYRKGRGIFKRIRDRGCDVRSTASFLFLLC